MSRQSSYREGMGTFTIVVYTVIGICALMVVIALILKFEVKAAAVVESLPPITDVVPAAEPAVVEVTNNVWQWVDKATVFEVRSPRHGDTLFAVRWYEPEWQGDPALKPAPVIKVEHMYRVYTDGTETSFTAPHGLVQPVTLRINDKPTTGTGTGTVTAISY